MGSETGAIAPVGAGTQLSIGNPLDPIDAVIETRQLDKVTEYVPADLTVHVESGVRLSQLGDLPRRTRDRRRTALLSG